jgi:hypothetical protein
MKTDELIALLARGVVAADVNALWRRYGIALACGGFAAAVLMALVLGVRPDLMDAAGLAMFWVKIAFPAAIAAAAMLATLRLSRPGARLESVPIMLAAPVLAVWVIAAWTLWRVAPPERPALILGHSWAECLLNIGFLSAPILVAMLWAAARAAPTRPALTGAALGLTAGALGAAVYALHCDEMAAPFLAIWYLLGMTIPALVGAGAGARLLRW